MNKGFILPLAASLLLAAGACADEARADSSAANSQTAPSETVAAVKGAPPRTGTVITLHNDNAIRPGHKVKRLTIIDFNATWCGPCRAFGPIFKNAAARYVNVDFFSIDVDDMPATARAFGVNAVPTLVFISPDGTERSYEGARDQDEFFQLINAALK